jgi:hypothetical protein
MNPHIISALSSLHTRLTRLEHPIHLAGREIPPKDFTYQTKSLETFERFIVERNAGCQNEGLPKLNILGPYTSETINPKYEIDAQIPFASAVTTPTTRFSAVCVFSTQIGDPFKYRIHTL